MGSDEVHAELARAWRASYGERATARAKGLASPQAGAVKNPASQAALARLNPDGRTAARFELFHRGVELANGFDPLDADEDANTIPDGQDDARRAKDEG
mgnify:CR=1 FL=1